jgi:hypothetical protein
MKFSSLLISCLALHTAAFATQGSCLLNLSSELDPVPANSTCLNEYARALAEGLLSADRDTLQRNSNFNPQLIVNPHKPHQMISVSTQDQWLFNPYILLNRFLATSPILGTDFLISRTKNGGKDWSDTTIPLQICLPGEFVTSDKLLYPNGAWSRNGSTFYLLGQFFDEYPFSQHGDVLENGVFVLTSTTAGKSW